MKRRDCYRSAIFLKAIPKPISEREPLYLQMILNTKVRFLDNSPDRVARTNLVCPCLFTCVHGYGLQNTDKQSLSVPPQVPAYRV